ncbi:fibronectin type III domain-containing protein [Sorangium sp. So ce321]|uniref:hypothetical protein n=1 Tax=Sorangium sp. So ce321 TaxID=3133300 RepID=UPI003F644ACF
MIRPGLMLLLFLPLSAGACALDDQPWAEDSEDQEQVGSTQHHIRPIPDCPASALSASRDSDGRDAAAAPCGEPLPPPPPPPSPPRLPSSIAYGTYSTSPSYAVSWSTSSGDGLPVSYHVQEQRNGSSWQSVYEGSGRSLSLTNKTPAVYSYRVRACSSAGCSAYRTGTKLVVNTRPVMDLYGQYPFLSTQDQTNAAYRARRPGIRGEFARGGPSPSPGARIITGSSDFHLGQGFNLLEDTYAGICIDTEQPGLDVVASTTNSTTLDITRVETISQLYQAMDVSTEAGLSFDYEGYSGEISAGKKRFTESVMDEYHELIVVRWRRDAEHWTLNTPLNPLKPDFAASMLVPYNANARRAFREACGDKYIYAADLGATLYMTFSFDSKSYNATERSQKAASLKAALTSIIGLNGSASVSEETRTLLEQLNVAVKVFNVGGPLVGAVNRDNFNTTLNAFISGLAPGNYAAIRQHARHYDHPTQLLDHAYFDIFADYRNSLAQLRRWNVIDAELERRTALLQAYGQPTSNYNAAKQELETAKSLCIETDSWGQCVHPVSYSTLGYDADNPGSLSAGTKLYTWLGANIRDMDETVVSQTGDYHIHDGGVFDKDCKDIDHYTCLPVGCVADTFKGYNAGTGMGFGVREGYWDVPGGGSRSHSMVSHDGQRCAYTDARICTSRAGDSTADYEFYHEVFGQCPATRDFPIVN